MLLGLLLLISIEIIYIADARANDCATAGFAIQNLIEKRERLAKQVMATKQFDLEKAFELEKKLLEFDTYITRSRIKEIAHRVAVSIGGAQNFGCIGAYYSIRYDPIDRNTLQNMIANISVKRHTNGQVRYDVPHLQLMDASPYEYLINLFADAEFRTIDMQTYQMVTYHHLITDEELVQAEIERQRELTRHLPCPYSADKLNRLCGERSAWSRPAGKKPLCYESDFNLSEIRYLRNQYISSLVSR